MNDEVRSLFPITEHAVYLNHAAVSAPPKATIEAVKLQLEDVTQNGSLNFRDWIATKGRVRQLLAEMLGARPEQVALMRNTSDSLSTVANGLKWRAGDNIVSFRNEFPSNVYPWLRIRDTQAVELRMCPEHDGRIDLAELINLVDSRTRIVALSHVQYASGFRSDLERVGRATRARANDALFVVDAIQALGVLPVETEFVDVAAAAGHKWLLTPEGVGLLYLSDRARERIEPTLVGWVSVPQPEEYSNFQQEWNRGALAWETGTGPAALIYGMEASLRLLLNTGVARIALYLEEVTEYLCERMRSAEYRSRYRIVSSREKSERSQIVCIQHLEGLTASDLYGQLKRKNIITAPRGDRLRISPHFYNTYTEIDQLLEALP